MAEISDQPIDSTAVMARVQAPSAGAVLTFSGVVRDNHRGRRVIGIDYHAYRSMALKEFERIEEDAKSRWPDVRIAITHRIGSLAVGEQSVLIAVSSPHRPAGFEALRFAIEEIKRQVPMWKKEIYSDGYAWIEGS